MKETGILPILTISCGRIKTVIFLSCVLLMGTQSVLAQSLSDTEQRDLQVVAQQRVGKSIPNTYRYETQYSMTKDAKGNDQSTYESRKKEGFCCLEWFSSEDESSTKAGKS